MNNIWDNLAVSYNEISKISKAHQDKYDFIVDTIIKNKCHTVLDAGLGGGLLELKLMERGFDGEIVALDNSEKMITVAKGNLKKFKNIKIKKVNLDEEFSVQDNYFECVVIINVLFFLKKKELFLRKAKKSLKKDGLFIVVDPKPTGSNKAFFSSQFSGRKRIEIVKEILSNTRKIGHIYKFIRGQRKIDRMHKSGAIKYHDLLELRLMLEKEGFKIKYHNEFQARQNWIFVCQK